MSFLVLPRHEQFYPESPSYQVLENLGWIKLAPKFKDFPAPTAIFKDFQGLELLFQISRTFKEFQGACEPCVDTDNQTFNCNNADARSQTGNRKNIGK